MKSKWIFLTTLFVSSLSWADSQPNVASCSADNIDLIYRGGSADGKPSVYYVGPGFHEDQNVRVVIDDPERIKVKTTATGQSISIHHFSMAKGGYMDISFDLPRVTYGDDTYDTNISTNLMLTRKVYGPDTTTPVPVDCVVSTVSF